MDSDEYQRLVLLALAEMVDLLGELVYPTPYKSLGTPHLLVSKMLRKATLKEVTDE